MTRGPSQHRETESVAWSAVLMACLPRCPFGQLQDSTERRKEMRYLSYVIAVVFATAFRRALSLWLRNFLARRFVVRLDRKHRIGA